MGSVAWGSEWLPVRVSAERPKVSCARVIADERRWWVCSVLHKAAIDVTGYDVWKGSSDKFAAAGAKTAETAKAACRDAKVVVLMVVNAEQAEGVLFDGGVAEGKALVRPE